jgi:hypothetical protein
MLNHIISFQMSSSSLIQQEPERYVTKQIRSLISIYFVALDSSIRTIYDNKVNLVGG